MTVFACQELIELVKGEHITFIVDKFLNRIQFIL